MGETASLSRCITDHIATAIGATVTGGVMVTSVTMTATDTAMALASSSDSGAAIMVITAITGITAAMVGITVVVTVDMVVTTELARADRGPS